MDSVRGLIECYSLVDWWLAKFTDEERVYIDSRYQPMGAPEHTLTQGRIVSASTSAPQFLNGLNSWFRSTKDTSIAERIHRKLSDLAREQPVTGPGYHDGRHFTTYVRDVEQLKRDERLVEAEELLLNLVDAIEAEARGHNSGVAPWYYEELAKIYRKQNAYSQEVAILKRFAAQAHGPGAGPARLLARLEKAKQLTAPAPDS